MTAHLPTPMSTIYFGRYQKLLSYAQTLSSDEYSERHHILPRSMSGSDDISNLIYLPARLHFLAHWLLWKTYKNKQMTRAFFMIRNVKSGGQDRYQTIGSRTYAKLRDDYSKNNPMRDPEIVAKISGENSPSKTASSRAARSGANHFSASPDYVCKTSGENHHMKRADIVAAISGENHYTKKEGWVSKTTGDNNPSRRPERRAQMSGENNPTKRPEVRAKMSANGSMRRPEVVAKISGENHFTKKPGYNNARKGKPQPQLTCPHCNKSGGNSNMARWHFDNCPSLTHEAKE